MNTPNTVEDLFALYESKGDEHYGEFITQTEHALQCAALARRDGATDALVVAALFHDVGHLVADTQSNDRIDLADEDDDHEQVGARILSPILGPAVAQPVALHVTAKRWRCTIDPTYHAQLSPTSQATLKAQGGLLSPEECARFEAHPGFESALALRSWDDAGKAPGLEVGVLRDYEGLVRVLADAR
jgi:phosphonate degradation associated HDIG domain protein